jgi:hypothetical protein
MIRTTAARSIGTRLLILIATIALSAASALGSITIGAGQNRQFSDDIHVWVQNYGHAMTAGDVTVQGDSWNTWWGDGANVLNQVGAYWTVKTGTLTFHAETFFMFGTGNVETGELQNYGTFTVFQGATVRNLYGRMYNGGGGVIENDGTIYNNDTSGNGPSIIDNRGIINNNGYIESSKDIFVSDGGTICNKSTGRILNLGSIGSSYGSLGDLVNEAGAFLQNGSASVQTSEIAPSACLHNFGTVLNYGTIASEEFENLAHIDNKAGATMYGSSKWYNVDGEIVNDGTIYLGLESVNGPNAVITNRGSLVNVGTNLGGRFVNEGLINSTGFLGNMDNTGFLSVTLDNKPAGRIIMAKGSTYDFRNGILNNEGLIELHPDFTFGATDAGTVNLRAGGTLNSYGTLANIAGHTQANDGVLRSHKTMSNAGTISGTGTYIQAAGTTTNTGWFGQDQITIEAGTFNQQAGTFAGSSVTNAGTFNFAGGNILTDGFTNTGVFKGAGNINGYKDFSAVFMNEGTVSVGAPLGRLSVDGSFWQDGYAVLDIELGGLTRGTQYDCLDVSSTALLAGELDVQLWGGFMPSLGDQFNILHASMVAGEFTSLSLPDLLPGLGWEVAYGNSDVWLQVVQVPEPGTLGLLGLGLIGLVHRGKRTRR